MDTNKQPIQIPAEIRAYLEDLLNSSGVVSVDPVMREAMIQELYVRLDKFLTIKLLDYLPTEKLEEFADITDKNPSPEEVQQYIQTHVSNAQEIFTMAFGEFQNLYLNGMQMQKTNA